MAAQLSVLQFFFALTWIVYVIYLPALAAQAGIEARLVPWILAMDQAIFLACDWAAGVYADRVARLFGRIGAHMAVATLVSCAAFIAIPWVAPAAGAAAFLALTALWSATSSALRAPPMALVSRHVPPSRQPWIAGLYLLGFGIAAAAGPYLGLALKGVDPRIPFALASVALALFAALLARAENAIDKPGAAAGEDRGTPMGAQLAAAFAVAMLLFGLAFQWHVAIDSARGFMRFAPAGRLPHLFPVFWIGFNLAVLPATLLGQRLGGAGAAASGGVLGVVALFAWSQAASLEVLVVVQAVIGAAWAIVLTGALTAANDAGRLGRTGFFTGAIFSVLAVAALVRIVATTTGAIVVLPSTPALLAWAAASAITVLLFLRMRPRPAG